MPKTVVVGTSQVAVDAYGTTIIRAGSLPICLPGEGAARGLGEIDLSKSPSSRAAPDEPGTVRALDLRRRPAAAGGVRSEEPPRAGCTVQARSPDPLPCPLPGAAHPDLVAAGTHLPRRLPARRPALAINSVVNGVMRWEILLALARAGARRCSSAGPSADTSAHRVPGGAVRAAARAHRGPRRARSCASMPLFVLVVVLFLILFGSAVFLVFDPLSLFTRSATTLLYPAVDRGCGWWGRRLYLAPPLRRGRGCGHRRPHRPAGLRQRPLPTSCSWSCWPCSWASSPSRWSSAASGAATSARWGLCWVWSVAAPSSGAWSTSTRASTCEACVASCPMDAVRDGGLPPTAPAANWVSSARMPAPEGPSIGDATPQAARVRPQPARPAQGRRAGVRRGLLSLHRTGPQVQRNVYLIRPPGRPQRAGFLGHVQPAALSA